MGWMKRIATERMANATLTGYDAASDARLAAMRQTCRTLEQDRDEARSDAPTVSEEQDDMADFPEVW